ncbi:HAD family phosphatase [Candidatus Uhrbacteria bacterium]|nr:HAD family phosphatase [Candidatus Uhrbacteria bacterium]
MTDIDLRLDRKVQAVIFDMDGVISDTQVLHAKTESELLARHGIALHPDEITRRYAGVRDQEMFEEIFGNAGLEMPPLEELLRDKWQSIVGLVRGNVREVPGTRALIDALSAAKVPMAVGSGSRLSFIEMVLAELGVREKFAAVASAEEVRRGKPEPDVFLLAAQRLDVAPTDCLVIEDGVSGMIAARRAGMQCIALVREGGGREYPADRIVENLSAISVAALLAPLMRVREG